MGLVASVGKNNDELVDNLVKHDSIKNERVERIMRLVDRGKFMPENAVEDNAYKDSAWKSDLGLPGFLHISAPYLVAIVRHSYKKERGEIEDESRTGVAEFETTEISNPNNCQNIGVISSHSVLEHLDLQKGQSFLNIGSGTGYLSTMAGFFLEENGINHGVELYENVADYAAERISLFQSSPEACAFEWCSPTYFVGNAFQLEQNTNKYDRIYCGALVPESHRAYFCSFLKEEGILVMPYGHSLQRVIRKSEKLFKTRDLSAVTFSHLIPVNIDDNSLSNGHVSLPLFQPTSLQFLCRNKIRQLIRQKLLFDKPVEIFSLYAEKHAKKASNVHHDNDEGRNQRDPLPADPPRHMILDDMTYDPPHMPHPLPSRTPVGSNLHGDPTNNNNRVANNNGRHNHNNNNPHQLLANLRRTHAGQFRHLFALFAQDRIRRHHEAIAHHRAARRNVHIINNGNDSDSENENNDENENEEPQIELRGIERQERLYSGPDDEAFVRVYKNNVGSLSSESYVNLNNDKNDDSYKTARMTTTPKKKAKTTSKMSKNTLTRLGLELSSDEEEEEKGEEEEEKKDREKEEKEDEEEKEDGEKEDEKEEDGDNSNESFETAKDIIMINDENFEAFERYASKMSKNSDDKEDKIEEEGRDDDGMENDDEKLEEEEKLNDSMNSSLLKNGNCNNKRLRTCTSNSMEMPQSSKIKRRLSYIQQQQEGEDVGPSTSFSSISGLNNTNNTNSQILSDAKLTGEFLQEEFNETKVKERTEQLADFHAKFIELIQSLPLNIQMRKFLVYENA
uniref:Protein-L-isoaspartate O-methyltransferase n=1 Tax=Meloidogyne floridensis TaxID=298350 RepID=A0A915P3M6_9BILA